jgi:hypothetical protein
MPMRDWEDADAQCDEICDTIADLEESGVTEKAPDYFENVKSTVMGIQENICSRNSVTANQAKALDRMQEGINKWVH